MAKLRNISYLIKEIAINSSTTNYELNGIVGNNLEFYGLDKVTGNYKELPKAWYQLIKSNGNYVFKVVDTSIFNYSKIQVGLWYDNKSTTYITDFNPDIKVLVDRYNILVNTVSQLWEYTKRQAIVGDSMEMHLVLPKLNSDELWICKGDHYEAISLVSVNDELRKLIDQYAEMYKVQLEQKTNEQKEKLNQYTNEQKQLLEIYKNEKIGELLRQLTDLKNQFNTYVLSKQNEMDRYKEMLQNNLYTESKREIDLYNQNKIEETKITIDNKTKEMLESLNEPIEEKVQLNIELLFKQSSPKYLSELKQQLDNYVVDKKSELSQYIKTKVDNFIATKDQLIKDKVEEIATKGINEAVNKAKTNVMKQIKDNTDELVQNAIKEFTNSANTLTVQKLKLIEDAVNKFIAQDVKKIIGENVNEYMKSFNVVSSKENGKIKLTFTLKDFRKEIELPDGELPSGDNILSKINSDVSITSQSYIDFRNKLNIPQPVDISGKLDISSKPLTYKNKLDGININFLFDPNNSYGIYNETRNYTSTNNGFPASNEAGVLVCYPLENGISQMWISHLTGNIFTRAKLINGGISAWKKVGGDTSILNNLRIKFNSNNSATFLSDNSSFMFNPETPSGSQTISEFKFMKGNISTYADLYAGKINASGKLLSQDEIISSGDITAFSDIRLKSNIQKIENALDKVCQLSGYTYDMNNQRHSGVIAQEVEKVLPEVVKDREDGYKTVAYGNMIGLLIEAIKELKQEIEVLKND